MVTGSGTDWRVLAGIQRILDLLTGDSQADLRAENARLRTRLAELAQEQAAITSRLNAISSNVNIAREHL